jgi:hypothetical protein
VISAAAGGPHLCSPFEGAPYLPKFVQSHDILYRLRRMWGTRRFTPKGTRKVRLQKKLRCAVRDPARTFSVLGNL